GPNQTGKKTMAQAMSEFLYKKPKSLIYRDMSLYEELYYSEQFIRKPVLDRSPVNVPEGLWDLLKENPDQLVYLDNIERAHPSVWTSVEELLRTGALHWQKTRASN
ncbi:ATPase AAA-2 domain protein, partial [mine drainage metagenome]